jgi:hypothetical protein
VPSEPSAGPWEPGNHVTPAPKRRGRAYFTREKRRRGEGHPCCVLFSRAKRRKVAEGEAGSSTEEALHATPHSTHPHTANWQGRCADLALYLRIALGPASSASEKSSPDWSGVAAMSYGGQGSGGWPLDYGLVEEEIQGSEFIYMVDDPAVSRSAFLPFFTGPAASFLMIGWLLA